MDFSDPARECAEAISSGLNVLYEIAHGPRKPTGDSSAKAEWLETLEGLAAALERTRAGVIVTDSPASLDQIAAVREVATLVTEWLKTEQRPEEVGRKAGALYEALIA